MKNFKSHFKFNKQERSGIFFLLFIVIALQIGYFVVRSFSSKNSIGSFTSNEEMQNQIAILKENAFKKDAAKTYPFNPNFITDYKGYTLGMSAKEIDRLHAYRKKDKYVNSPEEFQKVTLVSDSLLKTISPYFKFPTWVTKRKKSVVKSLENKSDNPYKHRELEENYLESEKVEIKDLNTATIEDLKAINGIGEKLSNRIVKFRNRLGGFLVDEQLYDVYFLDPEVATRVLAKFKVFNQPVIKKINVNIASASEISSLVYIPYDIAKEIISYREANGPFSSLNELGNIEGFPTHKITRIALYLSL